MKMEKWKNVKIIKKKCPCFKIKVFFLLRENCNVNMKQMNNVTFPRENYNFSLTSDVLFDFFLLRLTVIDLIKRKCIRKEFPFFF